MITDKSTLLAVCMAELPEKEVSLKNGMTVKVRALKGSDILRVSSIDNLDEKLAITIPKGLIEPVLASREIQRMIDYNPDLATDIFAEIMELSNALGEAEAAEAEDAKKN